MYNYKRSHRFIASFFLFILFPSLLPLNLLYANNNGPNAFDAAAFEPVDATDMVNLATGDMAYVLPLMNIPSPEGGYPLALSYRAGIAMDQEASWVGLGWALNPGAINRNVNGYPDDVAQGKDRTLLVNIGGASIYSMGVGANIYGVSVGVGAYWGSNKTLGGTVSVGVGPVSASVTSGSLGTTGGIGAHVKGSLDGLISNFSTGVTYSSLRSQGLTEFGVGIGLATTETYTEKDYTIKTKNESFFIAAAGFSFYWASSKMRFSLFKDYEKYYSGILYPHQAIAEINKDSRNYDVNKLGIYEEGVTPINYFDDADQDFATDNVLLPNSDKYRVQAQGISGSITPTFLQEATLQYQSSGIDENIESRFYTVSDDEKDPFLKLNSKLFFEFENTNASFMRIDRSDVQYVGEPFDMVDDAIINQFRTSSSNIYNESFTGGSIPLKTNNRKRTGKCVEVVTNSQIPSKIIAGKFIEARNLDRSNVTTYQPDAIGGYQITDVDGKVYHYSLPVINYEIWYKNYKNLLNESNLFAERELSVPFATDWLLTAVTGPDYVDDGDNVLDEGDYGYWVEFDYGKWTDGYIWKGNSGIPEIVPPNGLDGISYEYYRGRKQLYYLDAVRTRTHTAYFVKSLRKDAMGEYFNYQSAPNNPTAGVISSVPNTYCIMGDICADDPNTAIHPRLNPVTYGVPTSCSGNPAILVTGSKVHERLAVFPAHYSLRLDKIVLVKNSSITLNKNTGDLTPLVSSSQAILYEATGFQVTSMLTMNRQHATDDCNSIYHAYGTPGIQTIPIHQSNNVIDVNDLPSNFELNAEKVVRMNYDESYPLMPNSNNTSPTNTNKGKLTLGAVEFAGQQGVSFMPKYQFTYNHRNTEFNSWTKDGWGYHKTDPTAWCLSEIKTPIGTKIKMEYESDDYSKVAARSSREFSNGLNILPTINTLNGNLSFLISRNLVPGDNVIPDFNSFHDFFDINDKVPLDLFVCRRSIYGGHDRQVTLNLPEILATVKTVSPVSVLLEIPNSTAYWYFNNQDMSWILGRNYSLTGVSFPGGGSDGIILRNDGERTCHEWRNTGYDNDDVNFHYNVTSIKNSPATGQGGGIRVKSISVYDGNTLNNKVKYYYHQNGSNKDPLDINYISSGGVSFVPSKDFSIIPYISQLPAPTVIYGNVSVEEFDRNDVMQTRSVYSFDTFENYQHEQNTLYSLGKYFTVKKTQDQKNLYHVNNNFISLSKIDIKNRFSSLGRLLSVKKYNDKNQIINAIENEYYTPTDAQDEPGVKQESFLSRYSVLNRLLNLRTVAATSVSKTSYPNVLKSMSQIAGGHSKTTEFLKFDFLTGDVIETRTTSSDGKIVNAVNVPAYQKYAAMGSKIDNPDNKNMLTQNAATYSYLNNGASLTGVGITSWSSDWSYRDIAGNAQFTPGTNRERIWRKHKSFVWQGQKDIDGIFMLYGPNDDNFNWTGNHPPQWKQVSEVTLYDHYSKPLETKDVNENLSSVKMGDKNTKSIAVGNAGYHEMFYSSAEYAQNVNSVTYLDSEVRIQDGAQSVPTYFHTGTKSVVLTNSNNKFGVVMQNQEHREGKYKISVWVYNVQGNADNLRFHIDNNVNEPFAGETYKAGNWTLKTHYFNLPDRSQKFIYVSTGGTMLYVDDLMIRPTNASITGYVYDLHDQLTYVVKNNGLATHYKYSPSGRLTETWVEVIEANGVLNGGFKRASSNEIKYKNSF